MNESLTHIFLDSFLINNFVLCTFLGMCSFLGLSGKFATAWRMGVSVMFVITVSSVVSWFTNLLLVRFHAEYHHLHRDYRGNGAVDRNVHQEEQPRALP
jgi:electron transport complex protein RnfA